MTLFLERIADILDTPMESTDIDRGNIPTTMIRGNVKFDRVSFGFAPAGVLTLDRVDLMALKGRYYCLYQQQDSQI